MQNILTRAANMITGNNGSILPTTSEFDAKRLKQYDDLWAAYENDIFRDNRKWRRYLRDRDLHEKTICVYNPYQRLVDFYVAHIYPGYLSTEGKTLSDSSQSAIPLSENTTPEIRAAVGQLWQWGNWQINKNLWVTYCSATGDGPVEIVDDVTRGKVYPHVLWPGYIKHVSFDERDNVVAYYKELQPNDQFTGEKYTYGRYVDKKVIRTYKNGRLFSYDGVPEEIANPYGFCPLVWCKHNSRGIGRVPGVPVLRDWRKVEELNSDWTRLRMYIRKLALTPQVLAGMGQVVDFAQTIDAENVDLEDLLILIAEEPGSVHKLEGNLKIQEALLLIDKQIKEIEADHPEIVMYSYLRSMSQVTGPAAARLMGDVVSSLRTAQDRYDDATISMHQMMLSMAGYRANERAAGSGWGELNKQQQKFVPFNLDSYENGDLEFSILERPIIKLTQEEESNGRLKEYVAQKAGIDAGWPLLLQLELNNYSEEFINTVEKAQEVETRRLLDLEEQKAEIAAKNNMGTPPKSIGILNSSGKQTPTQVTPNNIPK